MTTSIQQTPAADPATTFFEELARTGHEPRLRKVTGRIRFDLEDGADTDSWLVAVDKGAISVAHEAAEADCTIRGGHSVFDEVVSGRANAIATILRGALVCHGDIYLLIAIQRIFPGPPRGWDPTASTRSAR